MIEKVARDRGAVEIRFVVPAAMADGEIGVAGDFNSWDPAATSLQHRRRLSFRHCGAPTGPPLRLPVLR